MKEKISFFAKGLITILLAAGLLFASCSSFDTSSDEGNQTSGKEASVSFSINSRVGEGIRSALPTLDFSKYLFTIKAKSNGSEKELASRLSVNNLSDQKFSMARAKWIFYVIAYLADGSESQPVLEGESAEIDLSTKASAVVNMSLKATSEGLGSVSIPVTYSSKGVKKVTCGLYDSATGGSLLAGKEIQEFTVESGINQNEDGTYSLTFTDEQVPSGKTVYARFILYDENDVPVGYYTESVYVAKGEKSSPVIYIKNEDGSYKKDESGNYIQDTEAEAVEVETNLFPAEVTAEAGKKVYAVTKDASGKELVYELNDEDGNGLYDTVLPPGDYTLKVGEQGESHTDATEIKGASLAVGASGGKASAMTVHSVLLKAKLPEDIICVGNTITARAVTSEAVEIPANNPDISIKWLVSDTKDGTYTEIPDMTDDTFFVSAEYAGKFIKASVTQDCGSTSVTKESSSAKVENGNLDGQKLTLKYEGTLISGEKPNTEKVYAAGILKDESGNTVSDYEMLFEPELPELTASTELELWIVSPGYEDYLTSVFIEVTAAVPEKLPSLKTDIANIPKDSVEFNLTDDEIGKYEYSLDEGQSWHDLSKAPLPVTEQTDMIIFRVKAVGSEGTEGYVAPSEYLSVSVTNENKGTKVFELDSAKVIKDGSPKVGAKLTALALSSQNEEITELVSWKWLRAENTEAAPTEIEGAVSSEYKVTAADVGKVIYVKASYGSKDKISEATSVVEKGNLVADDLQISYDGYVIVGSKPVIDKLLVSGSLKDEYGNEISDYEMAFESTLSEMIGTCEVNLVISAQGYEDLTTSLLVLAKAAKPENPPELSTEISSIPKNTVEFSLADWEKDKYEYSLDKGDIWITITQAPIYVHAGTTEILVRIKEVGLALEVAYIAASEPVSVSVSEENIGIMDFTLASAALENSGNAKVGAVVSAKAYSDQNADVTDTVIWKWFYASNEEETGVEIAGAIYSEYKVSGDYSGKYIYAQASVSSRRFSTKRVLVEKGKLVADKIKVFYEGLVISGNSLDEEKLFVDGNLFDDFGNEIFQYDVTIEESDSPLSSSVQVPVVFSATGYEDLTGNLFITVMAAKPAEPTLSTATEEISSGFIKFQNPESGLEYSLDGITWKAVTDEQFEFPAESDSLLVRKAAVGTAGNEGYVAPSDSVTVSVTAANRGNKPVLKFAEISVSGDISIEKSEESGIYTLTASSGFTNYKWLLDGEVLPSGISANENVLTIDSKTLVVGNYVITVQAQKNNFTYNSNISVSVTE